ncbi:uncharacterized protein BJ171DRAFT_631178 [Polychytrium aggregatum]|uniref:uncharacterized protein n=1 Tax=Polychytrium aggregatum TaxID=110093 RepID=UPI0022FDB65A|nr:uncharacterized protein BJ171DRAFT_631178 [Polychytrium aggregatum]KAI9208551.1 hypothetical protein BJ171DRAFT_631178 [Polychytrium aggregatum]
MVNLRPHRTRATPNGSISEIFDYADWKIKGERAPVLMETRPLTLFYHSERMHQSIEKVHQYQRVLLEAIYIVFSEMDACQKTPKEYRQELSPEDRIELENRFSENVMFAAQALHGGYRIRGIEQYTFDLVAEARALCEAKESLRFAFRNRIVSSAAPPHTDLFPFVQKFDQAWTAFERKMCRIYYTVKYDTAPGGVDQTDLFEVLMSETIIRAICKGYHDCEQLQSLDPILMFSIPRLAIVGGFVHFTGGVDLLEFRWFKARRTEMAYVRDKMSLLSEPQVAELETMLSQNKGRDDEDTPIGLLDLFRKICAITDDLQGGRMAKEINALMHRVFKMHLVTPQNSPEHDGGVPLDRQLPVRSAI